MRLDWKKTKLSQICSSIQYGYTASASIEKIGPKFLRITDIVGELIQWDDVPYCPISSKDHKKYKLEKGDIVVARTGNTTGYAKLIRQNVDSVFASYLIRFKVNNLVASSGFIGRLIESDIFKSYVWSVIGGSAQPGANAKLLGGFSFNLPPLPTQRKIAAILSAYDELIGNNLKRIKLLEEKAQLTYEEWFVRLKFPGHETTPINEETGLPEGWRKVSCYDAMEVLSGGTPKTSIEEYWKGKIQFFTPKDASNSAYTNETEKQITELGLSKCNSKLYPKNTVFITARGTVGKLNLASEPMAMNQSCYALKGKEGISQFFLYSSMQSIIDTFKGAASGGVFDTIIVDTFKYLPFIIPDSKLIEDYTKLAYQLFESSLNLQNQNQLLKEARDVLLPRLMTGMIDPDKISGKVVEEINVKLEEVS